MIFEEKDLVELKEIYFKLYKKVLNDDEALDLANRLISLFKITAKPIPSLDTGKRKTKNGTRNG